MRPSAPPTQRRPKLLKEYLLLRSSGPGTGRAFTSSMLQGLASWS